MNTEEKVRQFTPLQLGYIEYLAAGQIDENGHKISKEDYARIISTDPKTLYQWQKLPTFWDAVVERSNDLIRRKYPKILNAMYVQSLKGNVQAATFLAKQGDALKADRQEIKHEVHSIDAVLE